MATSSKPKKGWQEGVRGQQQDVQQITNTCLTLVSALTHEEHIHSADGNQDAPVVYSSGVKSVKTMAALAKTGFYRLPVTNDAITSHSYSFSFVLESQFYRLSLNVIILGFLSDCATYSGLTPILFVYWWKWYTFTKLFQQILTVTLTMLNLPKFQSVGLVSL